MFQTNSKQQIPDFGKCTSLVCVVEDIVFVTYRSHVAFLQPPGFGGVDECPPDRPHSQAVAAVLSASEVLGEDTTG